MTYLFWLEYRLNYRYSGFLLSLVNNQQQTLNSLDTRNISHKVKRKAYIMESNEAMLSLTIVVLHVARGVNILGS